MKRIEAEKTLNELIDVLASIEHERWSHWQRYMHDHGTKQPDGSLLLPANLVNRWEAQISAKYSSLTEAEKESDREQVRKYLPTIASALSKNET